MVLNFRGSQHLRQRLVCSTISGKAICIRDIRARDQNPGVRDYEASLLRLLEKITNGCVVEINETGALRLPALTVGSVTDSVSAIDTSVAYSTDAACGFLTLGCHSGCFNYVPDVTQVLPYATLRDLSQEVLALCMTVVVQGPLATSWNL